MRNVMALRDQRQKAIAEHPFFEWLHSDRTPLEERLMFAPMGAFFIMQFSDMNRWVLRFPESRDEFRWVINTGTYEDETHSRLFLQEWDRLGLDERLGWRAADTLWWLFLSPDQEVFRRSGIEFTALAVEDGNDPLVRFGHSEAGEATGHVMLSNTAKIAAALREKTGTDYRYFGDHHLTLESGHVANIEGVFESQILDAGRRVRAMELCDRMFDIFERIFTAFHDYSRTYVETGTVPMRPVGRPRRAEDTWTAPPVVVRPADIRDIEVWNHLNARKARAAAHPFYEWLSANDGIPAMRKLQRFIPMWLMDIFGYRDLNKYAMRYPDAHDDARREINAWAERLSRHSAQFLGDWDALELDDVLGTSAAQTLAFVFLDRDMDLHREHMIEFAKLALRAGDPAVRWWLMTTLESTGEAFFANVAPLALAAERDTGRKLDYLAGRHDPNPGPPTGSAPPRPLGAEAQQTVLTLVNTVFDAMEDQLSLSYAIARANKFDVS
jgi:hypothetical protein